MKLIHQARQLWSRWRTARHNSRIPPLYAPEPVVLNAHTLQAERAKDKAGRTASIAVIAALALSTAMWAQRADHWHGQALAAQAGLAHAHSQLQALQERTIDAGEARGRIQAIYRQTDRLAESLAHARRDAIRYRILIANPDTPPQLLATLTSAIQAAADRFGIPEDTLVRLGTIESHFRPASSSHANAHGIMGVREFWVDEIAWLHSLEDLQDPVKNINAGAHIFARYLRQCRGDYDCALAKYNGVEDNPEAFARYKKKFQEVPA